MTMMVSNTFAQSGSGEQQPVRLSAYNAQPPRFLIDCPTAGMLPRASFDVHVRDFSGGGLLTSINIGLHRQFQIGVSYGGTGILGESKATWQDHPEFEVKYQIIPETIAIPAVAVGFASQGYGPWLKDWERFTYKSRGFYVVMSKAYQTYDWATGFHGGFNYSLEHTKDDDSSPNFFFGFDMSINHNVAIVTEYDLALNDDKKHDDAEFGGKGWGYFNAGLRWIFYERLELGIDFKNLFNNRRDVNQPSRELRISYYEFF
jgi:hypothetical protein